MEDVRWPAKQLEEHRLEISNRIRNLFGQSVVIMIWNLNRTQKNMFIQNKRFYMRQ